VAAAVAKPNPPPAPGRRVWSDELLSKTERWCCMSPCVLQTKARFCLPDERTSPRWKAQKVVLRPFVGLPPSSLFENAVPRCERQLCLWTSEVLRVLFGFRPCRTPVRLARHASDGFPSSTCPRPRPKRHPVSRRRPMNSTAVRCWRSRFSRSSVSPGKNYRPGGLRVFRGGLDFHQGRENNPTPARSFSLAERVFRTFSVC